MALQYPQMERWIDHEKVAISSSDNGSSAYTQDEVEPNEDFEFIAPNDDVNDKLTPGQTWLENMVEVDDDAFYTELKAVAPGLLQVYKNFSKPWTELLQ